MAPPPGRADVVGAPEFGLGAFGIGGLNEGFPVPGFAPIGGAGLGLVETGGGGFVEREAVLLLAEAELVESCFFQGAAEPSEGAPPGNIETGLADAFAVTGLVFCTTGLETPGAEGGTRRFGGGGGTGEAFGFGGTSSR